MSDEDKDKQNNEEDTEEKQVVQNLLKKEDIRLSGINLSFDKRHFGFKEMDCSDAHIEGFSKLVEHYSSVESLNASHNLIKRVDWIDKLHKLRYMDLSHNNIQNIGVIAEDNACPDLQTLNLSHNHLVYVNLLRIQSIQQLDISNNFIEKLSFNSPGLPTLKTLNASHNKITTVSLNESKELESLDLSDNLIEELFPMNSIENLPKLTTLNLAKNQLKKIDLGAEGIEVDLKELKTINLSENQFNLIADTLPLKDSALFPKLMSIDFILNPFMNDAPIRTENKEYFDIRSILIKEYRHLNDINGEIITNKLLKKAFDYDAYLYRKKKEEEARAQEQEDPDA